MKKNQNINAESTDNIFKYILCEDIMSHVDYTVQNIF